MEPRRREDACVSRRVRNANQADETRHRGRRLLEVAALQEGRGGGEGDGDPREQQQHGWSGSDEVYLLEPGVLGGDPGRSDRKCTRAPMATPKAPSIAARRALRRAWW
jgi:hypothetical protein